MFSEMSRRTLANPLYNLCSHYDRLAFFASRLAISSPIYSIRSHPVSRTCCRLPWPCCPQRLTERRVGLAFPVPDPVNSYHPFFPPVRSQNVSLCPAGTTANASRQGLLHRNTVSFPPPPIPLGPHYPKHPNRLPFDGQTVLCATHRPAVPLSAALPGGFFHAGLVSPRKKFRFRRAFQLIQNSAGQFCTVQVGPAYVCPAQVGTV